MKKYLTIRSLLFFLCLSFYAFEAKAAINCSSSSNVQAAINSASDGDTLQCNATASYSWNSTVTLPTTKTITLDGNGSTISGSGGISIGSGATHSGRVTNFTFTSTSAIGTGDGITNTPWRIDHCTFTGSGTVIDVGNGPGLIDHCTFSGLDIAQETVHIWGWGAGSKTGWTNSLTPGSGNAVYFEDNTVTGAQGNSTCLFQTYYGGRVVARYNKVDRAMFDVHGNTPYSGRWWEFYKNTFTGSSAMCLRGGSGVIFGNTGTGTIFFTEEVASGGDQVGRGQNFDLFPAYVWNNDKYSYAYNSVGCAPPAGNYILQNRDVYVASSGTNLPSACTPGQSYWKTDAGGNWDTTNQTENDGQLYKCTSTNIWTAYYTPYPYPHPLTQGKDVSTNPQESPPPPPANVRIVAP